MTTETRKTIRDLLVERGENPTCFASCGIDLPTTGSGTQWGGGDYVFGVSDVKRFGDIIVVLRWCKYLSGYSGIRRTTTTTVYMGSQRYFAEDVYVDGGRNTFHNDRYDRDFEEIVTAWQEGNEIVVQLKSEETTDEIRCKRQ